MHKNTMEDLPKTERKDRLEQLRKMEVRLKDEEPSKDPAMTASEEKFAELRDLECNLAFLKLKVLELESNMQEDEARVGKIPAEARQADIACWWQSYAKVEESIRIKQAQLGSAVQRVHLPNHDADFDLVLEDKEAPKSHDRWSNLLKDAELNRWIADMESVLDGIVAYLTPKEEEMLGETPDEDRENTKYTPQEEKNAEDDMAEEAETEDDIRLAALFAQQERVTAQIKSLGTGVDFEAQNNAFLKKHDEEKAQRFRDALRGG